ncbi:MAG: hypothetical protein WKG07_35930 [Hymenobacter sp.]
MWLLLLAGSILLPAGKASAQGTGQGTGSAIVMEMGERGAEYYFAPQGAHRPRGNGADHLPQRRHAAP